ncbi:MAG: methyltransferase domain-containing protein [Pelagibaca sp.]
MLDQVKGPQDALAELQMFRDALKTDVAALTKEIALRDKMNHQAVQPLCARIDIAIRDYSSGFLRRLRAMRRDQEAEAEDRDAVVDMRREWGIAHSRTSLFQVELNQWSLMKALVARQVASRKKRVPLYETRRTALGAVQSAASDDVFDLVHAILNPEKQSDEAFQSGCFPDIALRNSRFHEHLHAAYRVLLAQGRTQPMRFLDVGCGGGLKVLSALRYFKRCDGLDYQQSYIDTARSLLERAKACESNAFQADALMFEGYDTYDIIYFYKPIRDDQKLVEMEQRVADLARPGTVLIAPYVGFEARCAGLGCGQVAGSVFLAKTSQKEADRWRRRAERTGVAVVHAEDERVATIWTPLLEASRYAGYDIERFKPLV